MLRDRNASRTYRGVDNEFGFTGVRFFVEAVPWRGGGNLLLSGVSEPAIPHAEGSWSGWVA